MPSLAMPPQRPETETAATADSEAEAERTEDMDMDMGQEHEGVDSAIVTSKEATEQSREEEWIVCSSLGHDAPRICDMCLTREGRQLKLMPWGGMAARLSVTAAEDGECTGTNYSDTQLRGQAFCFLPLPTETGLPLHANGYFELSANRRDIWYGSDMMGVVRCAPTGTVRCWRTWWRLHTCVF